MTGQRGEAPPERTLRKVGAVAIDATAFATYARVRDYRVQKEVDRAIRTALMRGEPVPGDIMIGRDGKLQRCPHDPEARSSHRGASLATHYKAAVFTGFMSTSVSVSRDYRDYGDPSNVHLRDDLGPYLLSFSLDPASRNRGPIARNVILSLKASLPAIRLVTGDREFSERRDSLVRPLHEHGVAMAMDYKRPDTETVNPVIVGRRKELLYRICGDFFPLWLPAEFRTKCPHRDPEAHRDWFERRARFRYITNGPPDPNGTIQFICPQCAGHIVGAHCTRSGPFKNRQPPGVPSLDTDQLRQWCCKGAINIRAESLDWWQPTSYGTGAHDTLYHRGRSRIKNFFNLVRKDGGLDKRSCRVSGIRGHNMVFLALALVNNVQLADGDPLADPPADDTPRAELSLLCLLPAAASNGADAHQTDQTNGSEPALPLRAPP